MAQLGLMTFIMAQNILVVDRLLDVREPSNESSPRARPRVANTRQ